MALALWLVHDGAVCLFVCLPDSCSDQLRQRWCTVQVACGTGMHPVCSQYCCIIHMHLSLPAGAMLLPVSMD
jgi:hypothetical protein